MAADDAGSGGASGADTESASVAEPDPGKLPVPPAEYDLAEQTVAMCLACEPVGSIAAALSVDHERVHELLAIGMQRGLYRHTAEQALALAEQRALLVARVG